MSQHTSGNNSSSIVSKIWAFCNTLRDDRVGYDDELATEIIENLEVGLESFREVLWRLNGN